MPPPPPPGPPGMDGCDRGYDQHRSRFLNGTVYDSIKLPTNGDPDTLLSKCCAKCTADGHKCDGWQFGELCDEPDPGPNFCDPSKHQMCPGTGGGQPTKCPQCGQAQCKCPSSSKCKPPTHCKLITNGNLVDQPTNGTQVFVTISFVNHWMHCSCKIRHIGQFSAHDLSARVFGTTDRIGLEGRWRPQSAVPTPRHAQDTSGQEPGRVLRGLLLRCAGLQQHLHHL